MRGRSRGSGRLWRTFFHGAVSAGESVANHPLRSTITLLGVTIGVLGVLAVAGYGEYASAQVTATLARFGSNLVTVTPGSPQTRGARTGTVNTLTTDDATAIRQQGIHVLALSGVKSGSVNAIAGRYNWKTQVVGVSADFPLIHGLQMDEGSFVSAEDERLTAPVAVLGVHAAAELFPGLDPLHQRLMLNGNEFQVTGLLAARGQTVNGNLDDVIYVPLSTALRRLYGGIRLDRIETRVDDSANIGSAIAAMTSVLEQRHHLRPGMPDDFQVQNYQQVADRAMQTTQALSAGLAAAAAIVLVIAGFGVMNIMLLAVSERTPEIGVRLAVGARNSEVRAQFLAEAATLCLGGAGVGCLVGLIASEVISQRIGASVVPPASAVLLAASISVGIGLVFGLYPAERAARLDPIVALRSE